MNMVISAIPVLFLNPFTGKPDSMPVEMIGAYVSDATHLHLEEAAKVACIRDHDEALNLLASVTSTYSVSISEELDYPSVQPEAVR